MRDIRRHAAREAAVAIHSYEEGARVGLAWYRIGAATAGFPHDRREFGTFDRDSESSANAEMSL
jgi:hypothetical protein